MNPPYPSPHGNGAPGPPNGPSIYGSAGGPVGPGGGAGVGGGVGGPSSAEWSNVLGQLDNLARTQAAMQQHMSNLSADYQAVIGEMINFQRNMVAQDQLMQNMIQYLVSLEAGESRLSIFHRSVDAKSLFFALGEKKKQIQINAARLRRKTRRRPMFLPRRRKSSSRPTPKSPARRTIKWPT